MEEKSRVSISNVLRTTPVLAFLFVGFLLTETSLLFPQNLGKFQTVAGWPLVMYKIEYRYEGDIDSTGRITRNLVPNDAKLMANRMFVNIILWTLILYMGWWFNGRGQFLRSKPSSN